MATLPNRFPTAAGVLFGLGLGAFFDGIVLHQLLQWHHMLSTWYPITTMENLKLNTVGDGLFHSAAYVFVVLALFVLWRAAQHGAVAWSGRMLVGTVLIGFGLFNLVEGTVDHGLLGVHHVNEGVPRSEQPLWDIGFLLWGALMVAGGWALLRAGQSDQPAG